MSIALLLALQDTVVEALPQEVTAAAAQTASVAHNSSINYAELILRASIPVKIIVLLLLIGSFIAAKASGEFRVRVPDAQTTVRSIIGGLGMGWGAAWAGGCTIGNAMVNTATFSFQGWTALVFMVLGTGLAAKLFILNHRGKGTTPVPAPGSGLASAEGAAADAGAARPVKLTPIG